MSNAHPAPSRAHVLFTNDKIYLAVEDVTDGHLVSSLCIDTDGTPQSVSTHFFERPELSQPYTDTTLYIDYGGKYCIVPQSFLGQGIPSAVWLGDKDEETHVLKSLLPDQQYGIIYSIPRMIHEFCERSFSLQTYRHPIAPLLSCVATHSRRNPQPTLVAVLHSTTIDLIHYRDDRLELANRYRIQNEVDALYYISAAWRHFGLIGASDHLALFGENLDMLKSLRDLLTDSIAHLTLNDYAALGAKRPALPPELPPLLQFRLICA